VDTETPEAFSCLGLEILHVIRRRAGIGYTGLVTGKHVQESGEHSRFLKHEIVPEEGVEPSRPCGHGILSRTINGIPNDQEATHLGALRRGPEEFPLRLAHIGPSFISWFSSRYRIH